MTTLAPLPVGTLIDCPAALPAPRPPLMKRMCGRCQLVLGWKVCGPEQAGTVTHGICTGCAAITLEELDEHLAAKSRTLP